jgi:hypothetical protein
MLHGPLPIHRVPPLRVPADLGESTSSSAVSASVYAPSLVRSLYRDGCGGCAGANGGTARARGGSYVTRLGRLGPGKWRIAASYSGTTLHLPR